MTLVQPATSVQWIGGSSRFNDDSRWVGGNTPFSYQTAEFADPVGAIVSWDASVGYRSTRGVTVDNGSYMFYAREAYADQAGVSDDYPNYQASGLLITDDASLTLSGDDVPMRMLLNEGQFDPNLGNLLLYGGLRIDSGSELNVSGALQSFGGSTTISGEDSKLNHFYTFTPYTAYLGGDSNRTGKFTVEDKGFALFRDVVVGDAAHSAGSVDVEVLSGGRFVGTNLAFGVNSPAGQQTRVEVSGAQSLLRTGSGGDGGDHIRLGGSAGDGSATMTVKDGGLVGGERFVLNTTGTLNLGPGGALIADTFSWDGPAALITDAASSIAVNRWSPFAPADDIRVNGNFSLGVDSSTASTPVITLAPEQSMEVGQTLTVGGDRQATLNLTGRSSLVSSRFGAIKNDSLVRLENRGIWIVEEDLHISSDASGGEIEIASENSIVSVGGNLIVDSGGLLELQTGRVVTKDFTVSGSGAVNYGEGTLTVDGGVWSPTAGGSHGIEGGNASQNPLVVLQNGATAPLPDATLFIGSVNPGRLHVRSGSSVGASVYYVGLGGRGELAIDSATVTGSNLYVAGSGGDGDFTLSNGAALTLTSALTVGGGLGDAHAAIDSGGKLSTTFAFLQSTSGAESTLRIDGAGELEASLVRAGPGTELEIGGGMIDAGSIELQAGSTLEFLGDRNGLIDVSGQATLGGLIDLTAFDADVSVGDTIELIRAGSFEYGAGFDVHLPTPPPGLLAFPVQHNGALYLRFVPALSGDFNADGVVDAADYTVWRDSLGSLTDLAADTNLNFLVEGADYATWRASFGASASPLNGVAPEPTSLLLAWGLLAPCVAGVRIRRGLLRG